MEFILPHKFAFCEATTLKPEATYAGLSVRSGMKARITGRVPIVPRNPANGAARPAGERDLEQRLPPGLNAKV